jgi:mannose-6-phosphate isomerase-like protein (cupin superfamily)
MNVGEIAASLVGGGTKNVGTLNGAAVGVSRMTSHIQWERHPGGDELLHVVEGRLHLRILDGDETIESEVGPGEVAIVPKGLWHSPQPIGEVTLVYITPIEGSELSDEDDPR